MTREDRKTAERVIQALRQAAPGTARKLGRWQIQRTRRGRKSCRIDILFNRHNPPLVSVRVRPDRTVTVRRAGRPAGEQQMLQVQDPGGEFCRWIRGELISRAFAVTQDPAGVMRELFDVDHSRVQRELERLTEQLALDSVRGSEGWNGKPDFRKDLGFCENIRFAINSATALLLPESGGLLDKETVKRVRELLEPPGDRSLPSPNAYNWAVLNRRTLAELDRTAPGMAQYYGQVCWDRSREPERMHPGQIVAAVREQTGLSGSEWKAFCRIGPGRLLWSDVRSEDHGKYVRLVCRAVSEANQPRASRERLESLTFIGREYQHYRNAPWQHGDPWQAWTKLLGRYLDPEQPEGHGDGLPGPHPLREYDQLRRVMDAFRHHVDNNLPWGPGSWETLVNRSERWHRRMQEERAFPQEQRALSWESDLEEFQDGELTVSPVRTGQELFLLGREMNNCLGSYALRCHRGETRIFRISRDGRTLAAAEIARQDGWRPGWRPGQVEAPQRGRVEPEALALARKLPEMYTGANGK